MLSDFGALFSVVLKLFQIEFTIYGFTFSLWQVFLFTAAVDIIAWVVWELFLGE